MSYLGPCAEAQVQLVALGVLNIFTDIMLLILPIPVMVSWNTSWMRKIKLYILFMLGIFIVAITLIRLPINALNKDSQVNRTTWASTELLTAGIVVNAPTLYGLWNMRRQQQRASQTYTHDYSSRSGQREFWHSDAHGMWAHARAGDSDDGEAYAMQSSRVRRADGILQTKELTVSEVRSDDAEGASVHSSQRGILKD